MKHPKLRDGQRLITNELYPINEVPDNVILKIAESITYLLSIGRKDISGTDWGDIFANAIDGVHLDSPVGIADVVKGKMAWSAKTVKLSNPMGAEKVRLISGRCSPDYSYGITDPHENIDQTGRAVLGIWNERVNIALDHYNPVRTIVLARSENCLEFSLFEEDTARFPSNEIEWSTNKNGNLIGKKVSSQQTKFTWQPHGSQFTIHADVPASAVHFRIKQPPVITQSDILKTIGFSPEWVEIIRQNINFNDNPKVI